ncbi:MAG: branched-chain amino acid transport system permease protein [Ilumatobacteraceae bacterium]
MPGLGDLWPYVIQGLAFGAMYAVTGTGLVVLYRTTGVVNLAFGAIGCMGAHVAWSLLGGSLSRPTPIGHGMRILAYPALVAVCAALTLLYGMWIAPKLARRDPLVKSLGMVGVALFLLGIMKERWDTSKPRALVLPSKVFKVFGAVVTSTQIIALLFAALVVVVVSIFLKKTATGTAMRAIANDRDVSALLGVPVRRVEALAWLGSGVICGCVFLLLPPLFKSIDQGTLTWFIIGALGGAIVGQFKSLPITFFASLVIGVLESIMTPFTGSFQFMADFRKTTPFVVAVVAIVWISRRRTVVLAGREMR